MATEYQRELARKKARERGKIPASDKPKLKRKGLSQKEQEQVDIDKYQARYRKGRKDKPIAPLKTLDTYGKRSTATSGGSKSVRKVTGEASPAEKKVQELRDKPGRHPTRYFEPFYNKPKKRNKNR